jgi:hypothetical protein
MTKERVRELRDDYFAKAPTRPVDEIVRELLDEIERLRAALERARTLLIEADSNMSYLAFRHPSSLPDSIPPQELKHLCGSIRRFTDELDLEAK